MESPPPPADPAWRSRTRIRDDLLKFLIPRPGIQPELWAWIGAYDHVVLVQLWGTMPELPEVLPRYTRELRQHWDYAGRPPLPRASLCSGTPKSITPPRPRVASTATAAATSNGHGGATSAGATAVIGAHPHVRQPIRRSRRRLVAYSLGNFLFSICMLFGVSMTSAVSAGVIMASIPAVVAVMSWAFLRERIAPRVWTAVACAGSTVTFCRPVAVPTGPRTSSVLSLVRSSPAAVDGAGGVVGSLRSRFFGSSSGAALAMQGVAAGLPIPNA